jgi:hypothetical protein
MGKMTVVIPKGSNPAVVLSDIKKKLNGNGFKYFPHVEGEQIKLVISTE